MRPARSTTAVMFVVAFYAWGCGFYGVGLYLRELRELHGWSLGAMTALTFVFQAASVIIGFRVGYHLNRFHHRAVLLFGATAMGSGLILLGRVDRLGLAVLAYLALSAGWACTNAQTISSSVMAWYPTDAAAPLSLALTGASVGGAVLIPAFRALTDRYGFETASTAIGLSQIVVLWLLVMTAYRLPLSGSGRAGTPNDLKAPTVPLREVLSERWLWPIAVGAGLSIGAQVGFLVHQLSILDVGLRPTRAAAVVSATTIAAIVGRLVFAQLSIWVPFWTLGAAFLGIQILALVAMATDVTGPTTLAVASVAFGAGVGVMITMPPLIVRNVLGHLPFGSVFPSVNAMTQSCNALGPVLVTAIHAASGGYASSLVALAVIDLVALVAIVGATTRGAVQQASVG